MFRRKHGEMANGLIFDKKRLRPFAFRKGRRRYTLVIPFILGPMPYRAQKLVKIGVKGLALLYSCLMPLAFCLIFNTHTS